MKAVIGLGNPGADYTGTRHNIGWQIADALAATLGGDTWRTRGSAEFQKLSEILIVKPQTYMNHSGQAVQQIARFFKLEPSQLIVVSDDVDLPFGELRYRDSGGSGGQKGLASVLEIMGTNDIPRLRVGVGRPEHGTVSDYVLSSFTPDETDLLPGVIDQAVASLQERLGE